MGSSAKSSFGVRLVRAGADVAEITKLTPPKFKQEKKAVTNHQSTNRWQEYIAGLRSSDDVKIEGNLVLSDAGQAGLIADFADGLAHVYSVVFPTAFGASWDFSAIVTEFDPGDFNAGDEVSFKATLSVTGQPVLNTTLSAGLTTPFFAVTPAGTNIPAPSATPGTFVNQQLTGQASVTVTPTASAGVITVNGTVVTTGTASGPITLPTAGSITPVTIVVQETGKVAKTYTLLIARA